MNNVDLIYSRWYGEIKPLFYTIFLSHGALLDLSIKVFRKLGNNLFNIKIISRWFICRINKYKYEWTEEHRDRNCMEVRSCEQCLYHHWSFKFNCHMWNRIYGVASKSSGWLGIRMMCPSWDISLLVDCCFSELEQ